MPQLLAGCIDAPCVAYPLRILVPVEAYEAKPTRLTQLVRHHPYAQSFTCRREKNTNHKLK